MSSSRKSTSLFFATVAAIFALVASDGCPDSSWRYSPHSGNCYKAFGEHIGWNLASFKCAFEGGTQITIHNAVENQFIAEIARRYNTVWIGMAQFGSDPEYIWNDHTNVDFENWHAQHNYRRPSFNRGKKCVKLDAETGTWMQSCCKVPAAYVCQRLGTPPQDNEIRKFLFRL